MIDHRPSAGEPSGSLTAESKSHLPRPGGPGRTAGAAIYPTAPPSQAPKQPKQPKQPRQAAAATAATRMPKAQAQAIVRALRRWTLVTSIGAFIVLGGITANNAAHASGSQSTESG